MTPKIDSSHPACDEPDLRGPQVVIWYVVFPKPARPHIYAGGASPVRRQASPSGNSVVSTRLPRPTQHHITQHIWSVGGFSNIDGTIPDVFPSCCEMLKCPKSTRNGPRGIVNVLLYVAAPIVTGPLLGAFQYHCYDRNSVE